MKFKKPKNSNYAATVVDIKNIFPLVKCDNICGTTIFGNSVIVSKDTVVGNRGVYFPAETQLSEIFASENNLFRHTEKNANTEEKGYLEDNRRIRTMKMRGNKSCGLWLPLHCLSFIFDPNGLNLFDLNDGDTFDEINGIPICNKYVVKRRIPGEGNKKKNKNPKISKLVENQFRFHEDTAQFGKNAHKFEPDDITSITDKLHGTSVVISNILCKNKLNIFYKLLKKLGVKIAETGYDNIFSSRKVIKNDDLNPSKNSFYKKDDVWKEANDKIKGFLPNGMTAYAEIVGFLPTTGKAIQSGMGKAFDYGCEPNTFEVYIYRLTYTNTSGDVFEFSAKQVQDWCKERGLKAVPELYYGRLGDLFNYDESQNYDYTLSFGDNLINYLREKYLEKNCRMCKNKLPNEGIVIRKETINLEAYKFKSFKFLEMETKQLDKGARDIEEEN